MRTLYNCKLLKHFTRIRSGYFCINFFILQNGLKTFVDFTVFTVLKRFQHTQYVTLKLRDNVKHVKVRMRRESF